MRFLKITRIISPLVAVSFILPLLLILCFKFYAIGAAQTAIEHLQPGVPIVLDSSEPDPIKKAANDLRRDLRKVLGQDSPILTTDASVRAGPAIVITHKGQSTSRFRDSTLKGTEAYIIQLLRDEGGPRVILQGADVRGTIYAIYTFSDRFLGVPPLWLWSSWQPQVKKEIDLPQNTNMRFSSPHVDWRVWFPNDKDLLDPWVRLSPKNYDAVAETMLRLKLNTLHVGGSIADYSRANQITPWAKLARDRGLAVITPYFASFENWKPYWQKLRKQDIPALSLNNMQKLMDYWTYHIQLAQQQKLEMIWGIGFRGAGDRGFFVDFDNSPPTDAARASIIQDMLQRQIQLLKSVSGESRPVMFTLLYREMSDYFESGLLKTIDEPSLIWTFSSEQRDHFPQADLLQAYVPQKGREVGYYMNLNYYTTGSHLAEGEGPWKMEDNFRMVEKKINSPLQLSIVNTGNIREFLMNLSANAEMMWDAEQYNSTIFVENFSKRYFGNRHAKQIASLYRNFYNSYWQQKKADLPGIERQYIFHDLRLAQGSRFILSSIARRLKSDASENIFMPKFTDPNGTRETEAEKAFFRIEPKDSGATDKVSAVIKGTDESAKKLELVKNEADRLMSQLPKESQAFFNDNLRVQANFMLHANRMLNSLTKGYQLLPDRQKTRESLNRAEQELPLMANSLSEANHSSFKEWYNNEKYFGINSIRKRILEITNLL
jgi:Glycosyl hydrolase family 115